VVRVFFVALPAFASARGSLDLRFAEVVLEAALLEFVLDVFAADFIFFSGSRRRLWARRRWLSH
jgi:hypothetical protein